MCKGLEEEMKVIASEIIKHTELDRMDVINTINWLSFDKSVPCFVRYLESGEQIKDKNYFDRLLRKLHSLPATFPQKIEKLSKMVVENEVDISNII